jgi:hypothetical protein
MESRPMDARYDPTFIGPFTQVRMDPRVAAAMSAPTAVAGATRFKYFRRPVMPRMSAIPPTVLLAPTVASTDPTVPLEDIPEPPQKNQEVQTMYRESEAQTTPYTPNYFVQDGEDPEVLMLKDLTFENGLPLNKKDLEMIHHARAKREMESHLPPFTDEASMNLRKRMMEQQEMKEFKLREAEIDRKREARLEELQTALDVREQSNELVSSQRVEAIRQSRMDEREVALQKIRNKRIKILRRLARKRNAQDPMISKVGGDPVDAYFDKASALYAPIQRLGKAPGHDPSDYDVATRTAPLNNMGKIAELEAAVPRDLRDPDAGKGSFSPDKQFSKTEPLGVRPRIRAAEDRLTSAAQRNLRDTKRDVEEMHRILTTKKKAQTLALQAAHHSSRQSARSQSAGAPPHTQASHSAPTSPSKPASTANSARRNAQGRPVTPDLTVDAHSGENVDSRHAVTAAITLLQKLIRGRSVQNVMYEGRLRRAELIRELRKADDYIAGLAQETAVDVANEAKRQREAAAKAATFDTIIGGTSSSMLVLLQQESGRVELFADLQEKAQAAERDRQRREYAEAGRRQKEGKKYPIPAGQ